MSVVMASLAARDRAARLGRPAKLVGWAIQDLQVTRVLMATLGARDPRGIEDSRAAQALRGCKERAVQLVSRARRAEQDLLANGERPEPPVPRVPSDLLD